MTERPERPLTRDDFSSLEQWNQYCFKGGDLPWCDQDEPGWQYPAGTGPYSDLTRALYGHSERAYAITWEKYGASHYLALEQLERAYGAVALANYRGRLFEDHLTIVWTTLGFWDHHSIALCQKRVLELFRKWFLNRGYWPALVWVLENSGRRGLHTHLLISVPRELRHDFKRYVEQAVETVCKKPVVRTPGGSTVKLTGGPTTSTDRQWHLFKYLFKGLSPSVTIQNASTGFERVSFSRYAKLPAQAQGEVLVKRFGVSRDLDRAAQLAWRAAGGPSLDLDGNKSAREIFGDQFFRWYLDSGGWSSVPCDNSISDLQRLLKGRNHKEPEPWSFKLPI
jgi:hypothetical protein